MKKLLLSMALCLMASLALLWTPISALAAGTEHFDDMVVYGTKFEAKPSVCAADEILMYNGSARYVCVKRDIPGATCLPGQVMITSPGTPPVISCIDAGPTCLPGQVLNAAQNCVWPAPICQPNELLASNNGILVCLPPAGVKVCGPGEVLTSNGTTLSCICPPNPPACGDNICNSTDTCSNCPADCGVCPPPPPPPPPPPSGGGCGPPCCDGNGYPDACDCIDETDALCGVNGSYCGGAGTGPCW